MAKGSHKTWGSWETRRCWTCDTRIVLHRGTAIHCQPNGGQPFSLCGQHLHHYRAAWKANAPPEVHPDQLNLEDAIR